MPMSRRLTRQDGVAMVPIRCYGRNARQCSTNGRALMSLNIKNEETHQLARELVALTGETMDNAYVQVHRPLFLTQRTIAGLRP